MATRGRAPAARLTAIPRRVNEAARAVAFDLGAMERDPAWRESVAWPLSPAEIASTVDALTQRWLEFLQTLRDESHRDVAVLAGLALVATAGWLAESALAVTREQQAGIRLSGGPAELPWLRGEADTPPRAAGLSRIKPPSVPKYAVIRRALRTASWTVPWRLPRALLAPRATAISHNPMLATAARRFPGGVGFGHAESLLLDVRSRMAEPLFAVGELAAAAAAALTRIGGLGDLVRLRLEWLVLDQAQSLFEQAARDLAAIRQIRLPQILWSGTGGYWPARAAGLEVLRRGGGVVRFDHGGTFGMLARLEDTAQREFTAAGRYVVATEAMAAIARLARPERMVPWRKCRIEGADGDPAFAAVSKSPRPAKVGRRLAVYAPTLLRGYRQLPQPWLADPIYLDWQLRLAEMLKASPVDVLCKPHPEGLLRGRPHPLAAIADTTYVPFEDVIDTADVFVFDFASTTAFWKALCTDRPVVFIDMGMAPFAAPVAAMIARRCRVIPAKMDERNRPIVDAPSLVEAVAGGPGRADPSDFRRLLAGEA